MIFNEQYIFKQQLLSLWCTQIKQQHVLTMVLVKVNQQIQQYGVEDFIENFNKKDQIYLSKKELRQLKKK